MDQKKFRKEYDFQRIPSLNVCIQIKGSTYFYVYCLVFIFQFRFRSRAYVGCYYYQMYYKACFVKMYEISGQSVYRYVIMYFNQYRIFLQDVFFTDMVTL